MATSSNDRIMTQYMVKYGAIRASEKDRPPELLEALYMTDCYRTGKDLIEAQKSYDIAIWNSVAPAELDDRLKDLSRFMATLARDRASTWGARL